jgi:hypothetical protein
MMENSRKRMVHRNPHPSLGVAQKGIGFPTRRDRMDNEKHHSTTFFTTGTMPFFSPVSLLTHR